MDIQVKRIENVVVGSGTAGYQTAIRLYQAGKRDLAVVTEDVKGGTSRNTGSDKQTYYKLSLAGSDMDSVANMAADLFSGGCVDGDSALCEAALSVRGFYSLVELGVPFPCNEFGGYVGYKTDHDRGRRATSAGPYTSKLMTECLERRVQELGIPVYDRLQLIRLLVKRQRIYGILCLDRARGSYLVIWCRHAVLATGGPAEIYYDSVYPQSQFGSNGLAFEAGVKGKNLTEWQYGIASLRPRWNVSGTYMQALPVFVSAEADGSGEWEFLREFFETREEMLSAVFLKGYQWPFDVNKVFGGSSIIDLLVYRETVLLNRRVYLDFTRNSENREIRFESLLPEAYEYLRKAGAAFGTPIERLNKMNAPAAAFYRSHGIDLSRERLEIAVCAQHNNGGLAADCWWETDVHGLFAVGEACGSHGVTRPGGTALNAGQTGAIRAADRIRMDRYDESESWTDELERRAIEELLMTEAGEFVSLPEMAGGTSGIGRAWVRAAKRMSACAGMIRSREGLRQAYEEIETELREFPLNLKKPDQKNLGLFFRYREMLITQKMYIFAMLDYIEHGGKSRGSALYTDAEGRKPLEKLPELFRCRPDGGMLSDMIQETELESENGQCRSVWRKVRAIPDADDFFENVWRCYRNREHIES